LIEYLSPSLLKSPNSDWGVAGGVEVYKGYREKDKKKSGEA